MANDTKTSTENQPTIAVGIRVKEETHAMLVTIMTVDNRPSIANTVETLLMSHPRIKKLLARQAAMPASA